jgi:hypothetical protein
MNEMHERTLNGPAGKDWPALDWSLRRAEREVVSHPGMGLLVAAIFGFLLGIWMKRT